MHSVAKSFTKYQKLSSDEQQIMRVLAVCGLSLTQTAYQNLIQDLKLRDTKGRQLRALMTKAWRDKLLGQTLIIVNPLGIQCEPSLIKDIIEHSIELGEFSAVSKACENLSTPLRNNYDVDKQRDQRNDCRIRYAVYRGDVNAVRELFDHTKTHTPLNYGLAHWLVDLFFPLNLTWFSSQTHDLQRYLLEAYHQVLIPNLGDLSSFTHIIEKVIAPHQSLDLLLCSNKLLTGNVEGIIAQLSPYQDSHSFGLQGWCLFLQQEDTLALESFELGLKVMRKETKRRQASYEGLSGVFHLLTLLRINTAASQKKALALIKHHQVSGAGSSYLHIHIEIHSLISIQQGQANPNELISPPVNTGELQNSYMFLFDGLIQHWLGLSLSNTVIKRLRHLSVLAENSGWHWFAQEASMLLATTTNTKPQKITALKSIHPITNLIPKQAPWERTLHHLKLLSDANSSDQVVTPERRMSWRVDMTHFIIEAREQKRTKNGSWTKGRVVALKNLHRDSSSYPYLTIQDLKICQQITEEHEYGGWSSYGSTTYDLKGVEALLATCGHPYLNKMDDQSQYFQLDNESPVLQVTQVKEKLHIQLLPEITEDLPYVLTQINPYHFNICALNESHQQIATLLSHKGLTVPLEAKQQVLDALTAISPLLMIHSDIGGGNQAKAQTKETDSRIHLMLEPLQQGFNLTAQVRPFGEKGPAFAPAEGAKNLFAQIEGQACQTKRDLKKEEKNTQQLLTACPYLDPDTQWHWSLDEAEIALETLEQLQVLGNEFILEWPEGKKLKLLPTSDLKQMQVAVKKDQEWFSISGKLKLNDKDVIDMQTLFGLLNQDAGRFIKIGENEYISLTSALRKRLDKLKKYSDSGRFHPLMAPAMDETLEGMNVKSAKVWKDQLKKLNAAQQLKPSLPSTLQAELRDYQIEGFEWLSRLAHWGGGACLADDMGLGKTLQALALILNRAPKGPTLILAPTSVCMNWMSEAQRFTPTLKPILFGTSHRKKVLDNASKFDLIVCSYGLLQTENEKLSAVQWHTVVADEAQAIKNSQTKRSQAAMMLKADYRLITTGTPIENHLGELWNLFHFINPGLLGNLDDFNKRFATPIEAQKNTAAKDSLRTLLRPFILRRLKSDVLTELPAKTEITLQVELSQEERVFYEALRRQAVENIENSEDHAGHKRIKVLSEIMRLRRACCHPKLIMKDSNIPSSKLNALIGIIEELQDNHHKALIFSQFVGHLGLIRDYLDGKKIHYQYLDGSTPQAKRKKAVDAFQAGEGELFLISLKAGGSGLNLTAADYVIHMDPWWNPAVEDQASDRAHRMGQQRPVTIYRLVAKDTIEEKIVAMHHQKRDLADSLLEGNEMGGKLSTDDIMALMEEIQ